MGFADRAKAERVRAGLAEHHESDSLVEDLAWLDPWIEPWFPKVGAAIRLPFKAGWRPVDRTVDGFHVVSADGLSVMLSGRTEADGRRWVHASCARRNRMPTYDDLARLRRLFLGERHYAYAVYPPADKYVNIHKFALHLWLCVDGPVTPEFSGVVGGERTI